MVTLQLRQIDVQPGQRVTLQDVDWSEFEAILEEIGEHRGLRIAYFEGLLELRMPLPEHEQAKGVIADLLKVLLDEMDQDWESLGSSTFKSKAMKAGIEPDDCFYIKNHALMIGKKRLDLTVDPPPELALEIDLTSKTQVSAYEALRVPEIWRYDSGRLQIYILQPDGNYRESESSLSFPNFPIIEGISQFVALSQTAGTRPALKAFRQWIRERLQGEG
jgi:Uma2 family endonuclease